MNMTELTKGMNKTEFLEVVKAAGIDAKAVVDLKMDADGMVEEATIEVENEAFLPPEIAGDGCGSGSFYSRVNYHAEAFEDAPYEPWTAEAGYDWNDMLTTYGDEPACDPAPRFTSLDEAIARAIGDAENMAQNLKYEVEGALAEAGGQPVENYSWGFAYFDLIPISENVE